MVLQDWMRSNETTGSTQLKIEQSDSIFVLRSFCLGKLLTRTFLGCWETELVMTVVNSNDFRNFVTPRVVVRGCASIESRKVQFAAGADVTVCVRLCMRLRTLKSFSVRVFLCRGAVFCLFVNVSVFGPLVTPLITSTRRLQSDQCIPRRRDSNISKSVNRIIFRR